MPSFPLYFIALERRPLMLQTLGLTMGRCVCCSHWACAALAVGVEMYLPPRPRKKN
jgi:hypothetical protein